MAIPTPLIITAADEARARKIVEHAKTYINSTKDILDTIAGRKAPVGDDPNFVLELGGVTLIQDGKETPVGFKVVYSLDQQPSGLMHHISMSSSRKGRYVTPEALRMILPLFGIKQSIEEAVFLEQAKPDPRDTGGPPVDVMFLVKPDETKF